MDPLGYRLAGLQLLWQCYDGIHDQKQVGRMKNWRQFVNFSGWLGFQVLAMREQRTWVPGCEVIPCYRRSLVYISSSCSRDYIQITNEKNRVFGKYCGHKTGKTVLVSGKYALIRLHSSRGIQNRGFLFSFKAVAPPSKKWLFTGV